MRAGTRPQVRLLFSLSTTHLRTPPLACATQVLAGGPEFIRSRASTPWHTLPLQLGGAFIVSHARVVHHHTNMEEEEAGEPVEKSTSQKRVGMHVSTRGGLPNIFARATKKGGSAAAFFLKNQRTWKPPALPDDNLRTEFEKQMSEHGIDRECLLPHGNYLVNLCNGADDEVELLEKSKACFLDELKRCELLGIPMLNIHPGSTKGKISIEESCRVIGKAINEAHKKINDVSVVLEITAGGGNAVGKTFQELRWIIDSVKNKDRAGVCLDTCHMFAAGYDIRTQKAYDATMKEFEEVIGFKYLRALHLNDSKAGLGSNVDRHENLGKGYIGLEAFRCLMNDDRMNGIPMVLETPASYKGSYRDEVELLKSMEGRTEPYPPPPDAPEKTKKKATKGKDKRMKETSGDQNDDEEEEKAANPPEPKEKRRKATTTRRTASAKPTTKRQGQKRTTRRTSQESDASNDDDDDFEPPSKKRTAKKRAANRKATLPSAD